MSSLTSVLVSSISFRRTSRVTPRTACVCLALRQNGASWSQGENLISGIFPRHSFGVVLLRDANRTAGGLEPSSGSCTLTLQEARFPIFFEIQFDTPWGRGGTRAAELPRAGVVFFRWWGLMTSPRHIAHLGKLDVSSRVGHVLQVPAAADAGTRHPAVGEAAAGRARSAGARGEGQVRRLVVCL